MLRASQVTERHNEDGKGKFLAQIKFYISRVNLFLSQFVRWPFRYPYYDPPRPSCLCRPSPLFSDPEKAGR